MNSDKQKKKSRSRQILIAIVILLFLGYQVYTGDRAGNAGDVDTGYWQAYQDEKQEYSEEQQAYQNEQQAYQDDQWTHQDDQQEKLADEYAEYSFRNENLLEEHYEKHGVEMGFADPGEYLAAANAVLQNPDTLHKTEAEDGDLVYFLEATNEFVVVSTDGYIRTYFYPEDGIAYYNRQ